MAVNNLRVTMEFEMNSEGWSETLYHEGSSPIAFSAAAKALVVERQKVLINVATIHHVRISGAQPGARSYRAVITNGSGAIGADSRRDVGPVTTNVGLYGATGAYRKLQLHGLPDHWHNYTSTGSLSGAMVGALTTYLGYLASSGYQIRHESVMASEPTLPKIKNITVAGGEVTFIVPNDDLEEGDKVKVSGVKGFNAKQFNGVWTVGELVAGENPGFKATTTRLIDTNFFYLLNSGRLRDASPAAYSYQTIAAWDETDSNGTRRTGRPTNSPRGRR